MSTDPVFSERLADAKLAKILILHNSSGLDSLACELVSMVAAIGNQTATIFAFHAS